MLSTLLVIGGVLLGLLVLLALIVGLSARPATRTRATVAAASPSWVGHVAARTPTHGPGRPHTTEMPAVR